MDKRRKKHTAAEQRRRNAIKRGYNLLSTVVPSCKPTDPIISSRLTKALILQNSIEYVQFLEQEKKKFTESLESLKREVVCLQTLKRTYEDIISMHMNVPKVEELTLDEQTKFEIFRQICDRLFSSFCKSLQSFNFLNLQDLSTAILKWIEIHCNPEATKEIINPLLQQISATPTTEYRR